jgi:AcrR family transcriptional regulator
MTQEADQSPAQAGAGAVHESARPSAVTPGAGPQVTPDAGRSASPNHSSGETRGSGQPHSAGAPHNTGPTPAGPAQAASGHGGTQAHASGRRSSASRPARKPQGRPSLGGGTPAQDRELRAQGRETVRKLLEAGITEFEERGFVGVRVDDVVKRAGISHGTFYLYFANKEDLFKALLRDALHDMEIVAGDFPVVTGDATGLAVLRQWVRKFAAAYAAHGTVLRTLVSANAPMEIFSDGLQLFYSITQAMTTGMTAAAEAAGHHHENAELTAFACLMMLERVNFVMTTEVPLPADVMADKIADIMFAAFGLVAG